MTNDAGRENAAKAASQYLLSMCHKLLQTQAAATVKAWHIAERS